MFPGVKGKVANKVGMKKENEGKYIAEAILLAEEKKHNFLLKLQEKRMEHEKTMKLMEKEDKIKELDRLRLLIELEKVKKSE